MFCSLFYVRALIAYILGVCFQCANLPARFHQTTPRRLSHFICSEILLSLFGVGVMPVENLRTLPEASHRGLFLPAIHATLIFSFFYCTFLFIMLKYIYTDGILPSFLFSFGSSLLSTRFLRSFRRSLLSAIKYPHLPSKRKNTSSLLFYKNYDKINFVGGISRPFFISLNIFLIIMAFFCNLAPPQPFSAVYFPHSIISRIRPAALASFFLIPFIFFAQQPVAVILTFACLTRHSPHTSRTYQPFHLSFPEPFFLSLSLHI